MNEIALGMVIVGAVLLVVGFLLMVKREKTRGIVVSLLGLGTAATPFVVTYLLLK